MLTPADAEMFERCMSVGGVAAFPADTCYCLAAEPDDKEAVRRLSALKRRDRSQPAAIMFFDVSLALEAVAEVGPVTREALGRVLPGPVTVLLANPAARFPLACGDDPFTLGLRVPLLEGALSALSEIRWPVLQSSATPAGEADARTVDAIPAGVREGCDLVLDGGELPGLPSTVVDLRRYEQGGDWEVVREGRMPTERLAALL